MAWDVQFRNGVWLPQVGWWLDAGQPVDRSFVSHAHFDHLAPHGEIICSDGTAKLMRARMPATRLEHVLPFGHTERLTPDTSVTLHPAGHIFGSAQILLEHAAHGRLLYTGDFKLRPGRSAEPCATPPADVLIMETTYGRPHYILPPTDDVLREIVHFCHETLDAGETPVLFGYSLGKSQELLISLAGANLPVMLHRQAARLTAIYETCGLTFPAHREFNAAIAAGHVVIAPPHAPGSPFLRSIPRPRTAMITGWALDPGARFRYQCDAAFPLSDHADFPDLIRFVERVNPRKVLTLHGFAEDFARTLRDKGIEAWAIGRDNQLEFTMTVERAVPRSASSSDGMFSPAPLEHLADDLASFAEVADRIKSAFGKTEKIRLLGEYLAMLGANEAAHAALYFTGRPFSQSSTQSLNLGWAIIKRALLDITGLNEGDYRKAYSRFGDSGDAAEAILATHTRPAPAPLSEIAALFEKLAIARGPSEKLTLLQERLCRLSPQAAKYLIKIITGDLRIGLKEGLVEEAIAVSIGREVDAVREANLLCGDLMEVSRAAREGHLHEVTLRVFHPLQFMLASPEPTADAILARLGPPVWLEEKYDGIRCQVHKQVEHVELFSRDLNRITGQFPDIVKLVGGLPGDFIIDGELLAWKDGRALPFAELQKRLGRTGGEDFFLGEEIPVSVSCYDLLWRNGRSLLKVPLQDRRSELEDLLAADTGSRLHLAPVTHAHNVVEIEAAFLRSRGRGNEGLLAKDPQSIYTPGRRGLAWLKLKKAYATLDVVVIAVEYGHGKRREVLSDYTFAVRDDSSGQLLAVGKAYSGLTNVEIADLTRHFMEHTIEEKGRRRTVVPDIVLEVAFDSIQRSDRHASGFSLRFPRIVRIRTDKTINDIDTLATCEKLAQASAPPINLIVTPFS
jgi:DNA ligase-1